jgi:excisionase family DNA binding protein
MKEVYTTGEAAAICNVSQQTIIRCFDAGKIDGFRVPGSRFRRIPREALIRFMKENGIPLSALESGKKRVLIVDDEPDVRELLTDVLVRDGRFEVRTAATAYEAGMATQEFRPDLILLDFLLPDVNGNAVCRTVRGNPTFENTRIIIVSAVVRPEEIDELLAAGADDFMKKPFDIDKLIARIEELLRL